ncbi:1-phosphatidylinositol 4,5-bisphosphate phosphodiesterase delta-4-like isoform X1 [Lampetra fluviatilis]
MAQQRSSAAAQKSLHLGMNFDEDLQAMVQGRTMRKVKANGWNKKRSLQLQDDLSSLVCDSKKFGQSKTAYFVQEMEMVLEGHQSEALRFVQHEFPQEHCFSVAFHGRKENLDLVASSKQEAQLWVRGLRKLMAQHKSQNHRGKLDQWIYDWVQKADKNKDGKMTLSEVKSLLKLMNTAVDDKYVKGLFQHCDTSKSGVLEEDEFVQLYKQLTRREEVTSLFSQLTSGENLLSLELFRRFLSEQQHEDMEAGASEGHAAAILDMYEPSAMAKEQQSMTLDGFTMYLMSADGSIFNPSHGHVFQDMTHPLSHYFISSSHNTYLMEDQLRGPSSTEAYARALKRGCRCVELDCWDGPNGEPIVYHGYTFTSKILFRDVIEVINQYAFQTSEFPLILSIENHCTIPQQTVMAQYMRNIFGNKLLTVPLGGKVPTVLPSPEELKGRILVKGKKLGQLEESVHANQGEVSDEDEAAEIEDEAVKKIMPVKGKLTLSKDLSDCVVYCKSVHFRGFEISREKGCCYDISSFGEAKARKLSTENSNEFVRYNSFQLSRVYPGGRRTDSSNYNPQEAWNTGCQIVALNFQTAGREMDLNDGKFRQNGGCGYILKPSVTRNRESLFDPEHPELGAGLNPINLSIKVISGQQLPKLEASNKGSIMDPLVRVEVYGVPQDNNHQHTYHIDNNGFNPRWDKTLTFRVTVPELALVRFVVEDYDKASRNDFLGQYTLPMSSMKTGYRQVPLLSHDGTSLAPSSLFVHVDTTN